MKNLIYIIDTSNEIDIITEILDNETKTGTTAKG